MNKFSLPVRKLVAPIVNATIQLHTKYGFDTKNISINVVALKVCDGVQPDTYLMNMISHSYSSDIRVFQKTPKLHVWTTECTNHQSGKRIRSLGLGG